MANESVVLQHTSAAQFMKSADKVSASHKFVQKT